MEEKIIKVWSWRHAIAKAKLPPTTKLVLHTLANYMNDHGGACFPSIETIVEASSLGRTAVIKHIQVATDAGFIIVKNHGFGGQEWKRNEYIPRFPETCEIGVPQLASEGKKGGSPDEPPFPVDNSKKVVRQETEGGSPGDKKVVRQVDTNNPCLNNPINFKKENEKNFSVDILPEGYLERMQVIGEIIGVKLLNNNRITDEWIVSDGFAEIVKLLYTTKQKYFRKKGAYPQSLNYYAKVIQTNLPRLVKW